MTVVAIAEDLHHLLRATAVELGVTLTEYHDAVVRAGLRNRGIDIPESYIFPDSDLIAIEDAVGSEEGAR